MNASTKTKQPIFKIWKIIPYGLWHKQMPAVFLAMSFSFLNTILPQILKVIIRNILKRKNLWETQSMLNEAKFQEIFLRYGPMMREVSLEM